jgi:hypothetical protein
MKMRWASLQMMMFGVCVCWAGLGLEPASRGQEPQESLAALFDGIPADLRTKVRNNLVRRDRVNDWLRDNVSGKGKTIEFRVPLRMGGKRSNDGTYALIASVGTAGKGFGGAATTTGFPGGGKKGTGAVAALAAPKINVLGDEWNLDLHVGDQAASLTNQFDLNGVNAADAEKLVDLEHALIKGKIREVQLSSATAVRLVLDDALLEGKKMSPRASPKLDAKDFFLPKKEASKSEP